jgi:hypothetical protein
MSLVNDILIKGKVIEDISNSVIKPIKWFENITLFDIIATYIFPLSFFLTLAIYLKQRYIKKKNRDEITLRHFMVDTENDYLN